jgi:hypothetical protein
MIKQMPEQDRLQERIKQMKRTSVLSALSAASHGSFDHLLYRTIFL